MLQLGVNIDHIATLRQARYKSGHGNMTPEPDAVAAAIEAEAAGAHGITVHLREDRRHIQDNDVHALRKILRTKLNLEMADAPEIVGIAEKIKPDEVCLVPERRAELTTEGGLDVIAGKKSLARTVPRLRDAGIVVSLFIAPDLDQIRAAAGIGAQYIELHTGSYANAGSAVATELERLVAAATLAHELGLRVNAGHGLNYRNIHGTFAVPHLDTLNIGHSIISRAVFVGLRQAVHEMREAMKPYRG
jgi:pyridoxine 5-phosphate synthase